MNTPDHAYAKHPERQSHDRQVYQKISIGYQSSMQTVCFLNLMEDPQKY